MQEIVTSERLKLAEVAEVKSYLILESEKIMTTPDETVLKQINGKVICVFFIYSTLWSQKGSVSKNMTQHGQIYRKTEPSAKT